MTNEERAYNYASKQKASKFQIGEIAKFYNDGYQQAKRDLEFTWKDMRKLNIIFAEVDTEIELCKIDFTVETLGYYEEVLKRFKDLKK